jgi:hypothetical protein
MSDVVIEVRGGNIVGIYGNSQKIQVTIIDWDNREAGDIPNSVHTVYCLPESKMPEDTASILASSKTHPVG